MELGRGVNAAVKQTAFALVAAQGPQILRQVAKTHFKTAGEIAPDYFLPPATGDE
jgi:ribonuclease HIII